MLQHADAGITSGIDLAYEHAACGLMSCTPSGQVVRTNATLLRWLGTEHDQRPSSLYDVLTSSSLLFFEMQLRPLLALGRTVDGAFVTLRRAEGDTMPVVLNAVQPPGGSLIELAMITVREREQYEATLRQSQADAESALRAMTASAHGQKMQAVGQMAAGIAHEFNNLLAVVRGNMQFAQQGVRRAAPGEARIMEDLDNALVATDRAVGIVRQLLAFTGRQVVRRTLLDINSVVHDTAQLVTAALGRDVTWQTRLTASPWPVFASADQLQHVLTGLVLNARDAIRATNAPGLITVTTENVTGSSGTPDMVHLLVEDTGAGMSADVVRRAFDPFFTTKPVGEGVGLGLSMVYGIVDALGGHVSIHSTPGEGTRLLVQLPRAHSAARSGER